MRKLMFFCRRRPDITHEQYAQRVLHGHVPLALRHHPTMRHYVVNIVDSVLTPDAPEIDSVAELSFDTLEDFRERLYDSPEGEKIIHEDVVGFMGGADSYEVTPHAHRSRAASSFGSPTPGPKLVMAIQRRDGLSREQFAEHWIGHHAPLILERNPSATHYVTNVVDSRLSDEGPDLDGIAELAFPSEDDMKRELFNPEHSQRVLEDNAKFIGTLRAWIATEHPQK